MSNRSMLQIDFRRLCLKACLLLIGLSACSPTPAAMDPTALATRAQPTATATQPLRPASTSTAIEAANATPAQPLATAAIPAPTPTVATPQPAEAPTPATDTPASVSATPTGPTPNPAGVVGLGAYLEGTPYDSFAAVQSFEELVGHPMTYALWFQAWGEDDRPFPAYWIELARGQNLLPVITWEPWKRNFQAPTEPQTDFSLSSIVEGRHDEYIRSWARGCKEAGVPIILRFAHEQSTEPGTRSWYPWQGDPVGYKAAFRHVVSIFRAEGATNVRFLWSAMWLNQWAEQYYPGDDVVDYIGTTVLNHGTAPSVDWAQWRSFEELFAVQYSAARQWNKPLFLTELATAEQGGNKAGWLHDCFTSLKERYPLVTGVLLLEVSSDREWPQINWSVASSPQSLDVFRTAIRDPHFK